MTNCDELPEELSKINNNSGFWFGSLHEDYFRLLHMTQDPAGWNNVIMWIQYYSFLKTRAKKYLSLHLQHSPNSIMQEEKIIFAIWNILSAFIIKDSSNILSVNYLLHIGNNEKRRYSTRRTEQKYFQNIIFKFWKWLNLNDGMTITYCLYKKTSIWIDWNVNCIKKKINKEG